MNPQPRWPLRWPGEDLQRKARAAGNTIIQRAVVSGQWSATEEDGLD